MLIGPVPSRRLPTAISLLPCAAARPEPSAAANAAPTVPPRIFNASRRFTSMRGLLAPEPGRRTLMTENGRRPPAAASPAERVGGPGGGPKTAAPQPAPGGAGGRRPGALGVEPARGLFSGPAPPRGRHTRRPRRRGAAPALYDHGAAGARVVAA